VPLAFPRIGLPRIASAAVQLAAVVALLAMAPAVMAQELRTDRLPDGLLRRPDLQAVVDLQVARDGSALADRLRDPDAAVRARAAFALASVQDRAAVPALRLALSDPDERVRCDAAFALGQTADSTAAPDLVAALAAETGEAVRYRLYEALGKIGDAASLAELAERDTPPGELSLLAMAIARYGLRGVFDSAATTRLAELLDHSDPAVGEAAAYPLGRWSDPASWAAVAEEAVRAAVDAAFPFQSGLATVAPMSPAPEIHLITALGRLGEPGDTPRLIGWLETAADWRARVSAARALGARTHEEEAQRALLEAISDPSMHVGVAAAAALGAADSLPDSLVHDLALQATLPGKEWRVTGEALPALAKAGAESFVILWLMWLDARDPDNAAARAKALHALGHGDARAGFLVLENEATRENPPVASAAVAGLAERWRRGVRGEPATTERYFRAFQAALERGDVGTVSEASSVMADSLFRPHGAVEVLLKAYRSMELPRDLEATVALLEALGRTGSAAAAPVLEEALGHPELALRQAAAAALSASTGRAVTIPEVSDPPDRVVDWSALSELGDRPRLILETERGRIVVELASEQAPLTVQTITALAREGRYDGVPFHRVVPNFVIQGGDFARGDGYGGPGFEIRSEFTRIPYARGVIGMASAGKDSEGSQYFITHSIQPHLDGRYTAFGQVVEGFEALDAIVEGDRVVAARVEASGRPAR
jgi:cyclophilin family peptidyl-prolyl cis-trans isomerase/HEAT repeat protein